MLNTIINNALKTRNGLRFILTLGEHKSIIDAINSASSFLSYEVWFHSKPYSVIIGRDEDGCPVEEWCESWFDKLMKEGCTEEQAIERIVASRIESVSHYREHRFDEAPQLSAVPCAPINQEYHPEDEGLPF